MKRKIKKIHFGQAPVFKPWMVADMKKSGIRLKVARELGFRPVEANQYNSLLGIKGDGVTAGMAIPFRDPVTGNNMKTPDGRDFIRVKLEKPIRIGNADLKYLSPTNGGKHAYILPSVHKAIISGEQVILTVGEKQAIVASLADLPTIGLIDDWGWIGEDKKLLPGLQAYVKSESKWLIICNSDARNNPTFADATIALAGELGQHKIRLQVCILPNLNASTVQAGKIGLDDYLLHRAGGIKNLREHLHEHALRVFHANYPPIESELIEEIKTRRKHSDIDDIAKLLRWCPEITKEMDKLNLERFRYKLINAVGIQKFERVINAALAQGKTDSGHAVKIADPEPWLDPVDGLSLVNNVKATIEKYLALPPHAADAMTLWVFHAHAYDAFDVSPILALTSVVEGEGKSTALYVFAALVPRPLTTVNQTPASFFRLIELYHPTLLLDEADAFLKTTEMVTMINGGHNKQDAFVQRTEGNQVRAYSVWAPKIIARIGKLTITNQSRAIVIKLKRKAPYEQVEHWQKKYRIKYEPLKRQLKRWALDTMSILASANPKMPEKLDNRVADNWRPLLAIADSLGGDWPTRARESALVLSTGYAKDNQNYLIQLLGDIAAIFDASGQTRIPTETIIRSLRNLVERPWRDYKHGKSITSQQLAAILYQFDIHPHDIRFGKEVRKGFEKSDFEEAFSRYLPPRAATPATSLYYNELHKFSPISENISDGSFVTMLGLFSQQVTRNVADVAGKTAGPDQEPSRTAEWADIESKLRTGEEHLRTNDSVMAGLVEKYGHCKIFAVQHNAFHTIVRGIVNQLVTKEQEIAIMKNLEALVSSKDLRPEHFADLDPQRLYDEGLFGRKVPAILELARRCRKGELNLKQLARQDRDVIFDTLLGKSGGIDGIGELTVKIFLVFYCHHLDILFVGDKALESAIQDHYSDKSLEEVAECWHPYEAMACSYLWHDHDIKEGISTLEW